MQQREETNLEAKPVVLALYRAFEQIAKAASMKSEEAATAEIQKVREFIRSKPEKSRNNAKEQAAAWLALRRGDTLAEDDP